MLAAVHERFFSRVDALLSAILSVRSTCFPPSLSLLLENIILCTLFQCYIGQAFFFIFVTLHSLIIQKNSRFSISSSSILFIFVPIFLLSTLPTFCCFYLRLHSRYFLFFFLSIYRKRKSWRMGIDVNGAKKCSITISRFVLFAWRKVKWKSARKQSRFSLFFSTSSHHRHCFFFFLYFT